MSELLLACGLRGIKPIIAHVERYDYIQRDRKLDLLRSWMEHGALFQLNLGSVIRQYGSKAEETGNAILKEGFYHFIGTVLHRSAQLEQFYPKAWRYLEKTSTNFNEKMHHQLI
jgi:protein-tyrosine phosphatase